MITEENLYRDTFGVLKLKRDEGRDEVAVRPTRAFPLSDPHRFVALVDAGGTELALIEDLAALPPKPRELLLQELEQSYFLPQVLAVQQITDDFGVQRWEVETDRGARTFEVRSREDLRWVHPGHLLIRDVDGNRYEVKRFEDLDHASRIKIETYL